MNRQEMLERVKDSSFVWDVLVIGGGSTGLGTAVDAASRGYSTLLVEQSDFAKGTSSRSTKLVHGGVRYLRQGHIGLVKEALHERGILRRIAPHLVRDLAFVVPLYDWWEGPFYGFGFKLYDALAGSLGLGPSRRLSREETLARIPTVEFTGLRGGVLYYDAQFDDARLALNLAQTIADIRGTVINYLQVTSLLKNGARISGVVVRDLEQPDAPTFAVHARAVVNATGVFVDAVRAMDEQGVEPLVQPSQGIHLVLDKSFLPGDSAIMVPHTDDGRVLFAVPWHDRVLIGTTDTPIEQPSLEPQPLGDEIEFLLKHAGRYLARGPARSDVLSVFAGLRPLISPHNAHRSTKALSREHTVSVSPSGLITITGGKWTTYRRMGEDAVNEAIRVGGLEERPSQTQSLLIHGWTEDAADARWGLYGSFAEQVKALAAQPGMGEPLHPRLPLCAAQVVWAVREEMARTLEDVLARRSRALLLDAKASIEMAPRVATIMAREMGRDAGWERDQVKLYTTLAARYTIG